MHTATASAASLANKANEFVVWTIPSSYTKPVASVRPGACHLVSTPSSHVEKLGSVLPRRTATEVSPNLTSIPFTITRERAQFEPCELLLLHPASCILTYCVPSTNNNFKMFSNIVYVVILRPRFINVYALTAQIEGFQKTRIVL